MRVVSRLALCMAALALTSLGFAETRERRLIVGQRTEPRSFNPTLQIDEPTRVVNVLLHAALLRTDPVSRRTEPALASSWKSSRDGREVTARLRHGLRFSDGHPLTVEDVLFSYEVFLDPKTAAPHREFLLLEGKPVEVRKVGGQTISFSLAGPSALGPRMLERIPILPRHRLEGAFRQGKLSGAWGANVAAGDMAGAGPFRFQRLEPGQRLTLERNPNYWRRDESGRPLPYLDEIQFVFAPSEDSLVARILAGEVDVITGFGSGSFELLSASREKAGLEVRDFGSGLDYVFLLFNLNRGIEPSPALKRRMQWFAVSGFRKAVSLAIDRQAIVRLAYRDHATALWGHVTPARTGWFDASLPRPARSPREARRLLEAAGFRWDGNGRLVDGTGARVEFTIAASASNPTYTQIAAIVQEDLKAIGVAASVVSLEFRSLVDRVTVQKDYDAAIMALRPGEADPVADMNVLLSSGRAHLWNLNGAPQAWETEVDRLLRLGVATASLKQRAGLFRQVQQILFAHMPFISLAGPNVLAAGRKGLAGLIPAQGGHPALANADSLHWIGDLHATSRTPK